MNNRITERELRQIIENNVRRFLFEEEEDGGANKLIKQLREPGINQAEIARDLIKDVWSGMDIDTARSLLSKKVRGEISINDREKYAIKKSLSSLFKMQ